MLNKEPVCLIFRQVLTLIERIVVITHLGRNFARRGMQLATYSCKRSSEKRNVGKEMLDRQ